MRAITLSVLGGCSLVLASAVGASDAARVVVSVTPRDALIDQPVAITVSGVRPRSTVTLTATTRSAPGNLWKSTATFRADASGRVVVARSPALSGTYRGRDAMGLFWSMRWGTQVDVAMLPSPVSAVRISASTGGARTQATASLVRRTQTSDLTVRKATLAAEGFVGCYYSRPAEVPRPLPAILFLGGSNGGAPCDLRPALLASRGYPTLALGYFDEPGLPAELKNIPLEYFESALRWLAQQPGVDPDRLVVLGISRGGECALLLGTVYHPELIHGVVSYVGSSLVWGTRYTVAGPHDQQEPSWTLGGKPVPFASGFEDAQAVIPVEKIAGPLFVVGAVEDTLWPSALFTNNIVRRLKEHRRTDYAALVYPNAAHAVGWIIPNIPVIVDLGGTRAADARARADSWPKLLAFLERLR